MTKLSSRITAAAVLIFIAVFSLFTLFGRKESFSVQEDRELAELPVPALSSLFDGSYSEALGVYAADHFAWRSKWVALSSSISSEIGESIVHGVYIGNDMLLDTSVSDRTSAEAAAYEINRYAEETGSALYLAAIPTSSGVYGELLPEYLLTDPESRQISRFYESLSTGIRRIDAYNILKSQKDNYIYYRNDTKWTSYGAYCVYRSVIQKLGFIPIAYDKYTIDHISGDFLGNLYKRSQITNAKPDIIDVYKYAGGAEVTSCIGYDTEGLGHVKELYDRKQLESGYMYDVYLGEPCPLTEIHTSVNNEKKLLIIGDSFVQSFVPFLTQHYSEITVFVPELSGGSLRKWTDPNEYEQTLLVFGIDSLSSSGLLEVINQ